VHFYTIMYRKPTIILPPARLFTKMHEKHNIKTACTNVLSGDEHMMFEIFRRHQELD